MLEFNGPPAKPFDKSVLLAIINDTVLKKDLRIPADYPGLDTFTSVLNSYASLAANRVGEWEKQRNLVDRIRCALESLSEDIPSIIAEFYVTAEADRAEGTITSLADVFPKDLRSKIEAEFWHFSREAAIAAIAELDAIESLQRAVLIAQELGVARIRFPDWAVYHKWEGFARELEALFHHHFIGATKAAGYRFIESVMPLITGERPTMEAIRTYLKRNRPLSCRERKSRRTGPDNKQGK